LGERNVQGKGKREGTQKKTKKRSNFPKGRMKIGLRKGGPKIDFGRRKKKKGFGPNSKRKEEWPEERADVSALLRKGQDYCCKEEITERGKKNLKRGKAVLRTDQGKQPAPRKTRWEEGKWEKIIEGLMKHWKPTLYGEGKKCQEILVNFRPGEGKTGRKNVLQRGGKKTSTGWKGGPEEPCGQKKKLRIAISAFMFKNVKFCGGESRGSERKGEHRLQGRKCS